jgi:hypothetical protein
VSFARRTFAALTASTLLAAAPLAAPAIAQAPQRAPAAASAQDGIGIRLLDAAVSRKDDPRAHVYIDDHLRPGTSITRHVQVTNFTAKRQSVHMYAVASTIEKDGWRVADGREANELTSWMEVTPAEVTLQPGRSATVTVQIDVPVDASKGERYATVVAELPAGAPAAGANVSVTTRVGVRVYLNVGSGGEPASDFTISTLTAARDADGVPTVSAQVTNTGGRALDLGGRLVLTDGPGGLRAGPFEVQVPRTLGIGQSGDVVVVLDKQTPAGPWLGKMTLRSGYVEHSVKGTLLFPDAAGAAAEPVKAIPITENRNILVPFAVLLILGLAIGLILFLLWKRRRRKDDDDEPASGGPTPSLPAQRLAPPVAEPEPVPATRVERPAREEANVDGAINRLRRG